MYQVLPHLSERPDLGHGNLRGMVNAVLVPVLLLLLLVVVVVLISVVVLLFVLAVLARRSFLPSTGTDVVSTPDSNGSG
jgi:ABC-type anion transport system duplicated permease subunit